MFRRINMSVHDDINTNSKGPLNHLHRVLWLLLVDEGKQIYVNEFKLEGYVERLNNNWRLTINFQRLGDETNDWNISMMVSRNNCVPEEANTEFNIQDGVFTSTLFFDNSIVISKQLPSHHCVILNTLVQRLTTNRDIDFKGYALTTIMKYPKEQVINFMDKTNELNIQADGKMFYSEGCKLKGLKVPAGVLPLVGEFNY